MNNTSSSWIKLNLRPDASSGGGERVGDEAVAEFKGPWDKEKGLNEVGRKGSFYFNVST